MTNVEIKNWDSTEYGDKSFRQGHSKMPETQMRACLVGVSGQGKTNTACDLIMRYLAWDNLKVFSPSIEQPKWLMMKDLCDKMELTREKKALAYCEKFNKGKPIHKRITLEDLDLQPIGEFYDSLNNLCMDDIDKKHQTLVVIDDFMLEKNQKNCIELFSRGRLKNINTMYLSQDWFTIPKNVRRNTNLFLLWGNLPDMNIDMIRRDGGIPMDKNQWRQAYKDGTKEPYSFIVIDKTKSDMDKQFTINFNEPLFKSTEKDPQKCP
jgi:hypothetical protein